MKTRLLDAGRLPPALHSFFADGRLVSAAPST